MTLTIDLNQNKIKGTATAGDIKEKGLIPASLTIRINMKCITCGRMTTKPKNDKRTRCRKCEKAGFTR